MQIKIPQGYKSIPHGIEFELPLFTVLTGENGSGKTHLFEAINNSKNSQVLIDGNQVKTINYVPFGGLNPQGNQKCNPTQISAQAI